MSKINRIAAAFLRELENGNNVYQEEKINVEPLAALTGLVVLRRPQMPHYFQGFKPSGRPVFAYDVRLGHTFDAQHPSLEDHIERLTEIGESVCPHPTVWIEGRHKSDA